MLHALPSAAPPPAPPHAAALDPDIDRARRYIAAARACGLVLAPWHGPKNEPFVLVAGQQADGPNDFSAGMDRLVLHPDGRAAHGCRKGLVHALLCDELGLDPDDPDLCDKVNATYREPEQAAS